MCVSSVGFAWGVLRGVLGEYAVVLFSKLMRLQCTMFCIFDWEVGRLGMRERVKTRNDNGLRIWICSQELPFSVEKKSFKDKFRKYTTLYIPIPHITNISDFEFAAQ